MFIKNNFRALESLSTIHTVRVAIALSRKWSRGPSAAYTRCAIRMGAHRIFKRSNKASGEMRERSAGARLNGPGRHSLPPRSRQILCVWPHHVQWCYFTRPNNSCTTTRQFIFRETTALLHKSKAMSNFQWIFPYFVFLFFFLLLFCLSIICCGLAGVRA